VIGVGGRGRGSGQHIEMGGRTTRGRTLCAIGVGDFLRKRGRSASRHTPGWTSPDGRGLIATRPAFSAGNGRFAYGPLSASSSPGETRPTGPARRNRTRRKGPHRRRRPTFLFVSGRGGPWPPAREERQLSGLLAAFHHQRRGFNCVVGVRPRDRFARPGPSVRQPG